MTDWQGEEWDLTQPNRQSLIGVVIYLARNFRALATILISLVAIAASQPKIWIYIGIGIIPLMFVFSLLAYLQYRNFTFHVSDEELIIHRGVFVKDRTVIPAERIQTIQITQNLLQRIVGLVSLKVDTAGSKGSELEIPALERVRARHMQELLYHKKKQILAERKPVGTFQDDISIPPDEALAPTSRAYSQEPERVLVRLGIGDLLLVGITENHLKTGFIALAFVFGYLSQYREIIEQYLAGYFDSYASQVANAGIAMLLAGLVLFAILSVILSLGRTILRFFNLKAVLRTDAVEVSTGLLRRDENRVPIKKIQYIEWHTNPLRRLVGFESAKIKPSGAVAQNSKSQNIEIPALRRRQSTALAEGAFPGYRLPKTRVDADAWGYTRLYTILSGAFSLPVILVLYFAFGFGSYSLYPLLAVALVGALGYRYGRSVHMRINGHFISVARGWIFPVRTIVPTYKIQAVSIEQSIFLDRRGLCHLRLHTAAGDKFIRYLDRRDALEINDFILYTTESHRGSWM